MLGAIAGDIIGSIHERTPVASRDFPLFTNESRFTDDTVLTVAVADCLLHELPYDETIRKYALAYPCLLYTSPSPRDGATSRMPSSA